MMCGCDRCGSLFQMSSEMTLHYPRDRMTTRTYYCAIMQHSKSPAHLTEQCSSTFQKPATKMWRSYKISERALAPTTLNLASRRA